MCTFYSINSFYWNWALTHSFPRTNLAHHSKNQGVQSWKLPWWKAYCVKAYNSTFRQIITTQWLESFSPLRTRTNWTKPHYQNNIPILVITRALSQTWLKIPLHCFVTEIAAMQMLYFNGTLLINEWITARENCVFYIYTSWI